MAISADFIEAVDSHNLTKTRVMLKDSMFVDLTMSSFNERLTYAEEKMPDLFEEHDGEPLSNDITTWTKDYLAELASTAMLNFSRIRVDQMKKVCRHVYATKAEEMDRKAFVDEHKPVLTQKQVGIGVVAGGAIVTVAGIGISQPVVAAAGAVIMVVGGVIIYKSR